MEELLTMMQHRQTIRQELAEAPPAAPTTPAATPTPPALWWGVQRSPEMPAPHPAPPVADEAVPSLFRAGTNWLNHGAGGGFGPMWQTYEIRDERMRTLADLMVRPDVPIVVRADQERLVVQGNEDQQRAFKEFAELLSGRLETRSYRLPPEKLRILNALLTRDDVPVSVTPGDGELRVTALDSQHRIIQRFIEMIHPSEHNHVPSHNSR